MTNNEKIRRRRCNQPEDKKSEGRQNSDDDAGQDDWVGVECHLPAPPGEEPLQPGEGEVRFGVQLNQVWCHQAKSGDIPANDESVCGLHNDFLAPTFPFSRSSYSDPLPTFDLTGCTALSLTPAPVLAWLKSGTSPGLLLHL